MKHTLIANGRRIGYHVNGRAKSLPLVLLHGFCEDHTVWNPTMPGLKNCRVVRVDLPGFGGSAPLRKLKTFEAPAAAGMDQYADAVCAVLNELGLARCVMVGHSMGGYATLAFAERYPERLAGWGLFNSHPFADGEKQRDNRQRGVETLRSGKKDLYVAQLFPALFAPEFAAAHPDIVETLVRRGRRQPAESIAAALLGMMDRPDRRAVLRAAAVPVLFLMGEKDQLVPAEYRQEMTPLPRIADIRLLSGVGHMAMIEAPEKAAAILRDFHAFCIQFEKNSP